MDAIIAYILENAPWLVVVGLSVVGAWKLSKYHSRLEATNEKVENLPCSEHDARHMAIMDKLNTIITYLQTKYPTSVNIFSAKASPRKLNDLGRSLYEKSGGDEFLSNNLDYFIGLIDKKKPRTALDVETSANEVLMESLDQDIFNGLKRWVYNSPSWKISINGEKRDYSITMNDICFVISIKLRDAYLMAHPELEDGENQ